MPDPSNPVVDGEYFLDLSAFDTVVRPAPPELSEEEFNSWRIRGRVGCFWDGGYGYQTTLTNIRMPYAWTTALNQLRDANPNLDSWLENRSSHFDTKFGRESIVFKVRERPLIAKFSIALTEEAFSLALSPNEILTSYGRDLVDRIWLMAATDSQEYLDRSPLTMEAKLQMFNLASRAAQVAYQFDFYESDLRHQIERETGISFPKPIAWSTAVHQSNAFAFVILVQEMVLQDPGASTLLSNEEVERRRQLLIKASPSVQFDVLFDLRNLVLSGDGRIFYVDHVHRGNRSTAHSYDHYLDLNKLISQTSE